MGMYWTTYLYDGCLINRQQYERVQGTTDKAVLHNVNDGCWILHAPGRWLVMGSMDPVLEDHEIAAGYVDAAELQAWLAKRPDALEAWQAASDRTLLEELVARAAGGGPTLSGTRVCQVGWDTYGGAARVEHDLPVRSRDDR